MASRFWAAPRRESFVRSIEFRFRFGVSGRLEIDHGRAVAVGGEDVVVGVVFEFNDLDGTAAEVVAVGM